MRRNSENSLINSLVQGGEIRTDSHRDGSHERPGYVDLDQLQGRKQHVPTQSEKLVTEALRHFRLPLKFLKSSDASGTNQLPNHIDMTSGGTHGEEVEVQELPIDAGAHTANTCPRPIVKGPKPIFQRFRSRYCRADPWTSCEMAKVEKALNYARLAAPGVAKITNIMLTSTSSARLEMWNKAGILKRFFGGYDYQHFLFTDDYRMAVLWRLRRIAEDTLHSQHYFLKVRRQLNGCNKKCKDDRVAFTNAEKKHRTYICPAFFTNGNLDEPCQGARLLLHEFGHKDGIIGDPVYGRLDSIALAAQNDIFWVHAQRNAENYAYFFMNLFHDPHLLLDSKDTGWCTFWKP